MSRVRSITTIVAVAAIVVGMGGCVSSSTHNKVLADLAQTRSNLQQEQVARSALAQDNSRLKTGLAMLSDRCKSAQERVQSLNEAMSRVRVGEKRVATALDTLHQLIMAQAGSTAALAATSSPLAADMDMIQAKTAALLDGSPRQREVGVGMEMPHASVVSSAAR